MENKKIGFIGCGNMGNALIQGIILSEIIKAKDIIVIDKDKDKEDIIVSQLKVKKAKNLQELATSADYILLAVKPHDVSSVMEEISALDIKNKVIISIAAGVTMESINNYKKSLRVVRVMPNTPALVGEGMSAICYERMVKKEDREFITRVFESVGMVIEVDESQMNAITALSGSSPACAFMFIEAMADAGVRMGLQRETSVMIAAQAVLGSARMVLETGVHPGQLKDMVCSPAGTTIEAVYTLEKRGFRGTVMKAMGECFERAEELNEEKED